MYGFRTHHQVAVHIRPRINSNIETRHTAEQTNPLGEGESDCKLDRITMTDAWFITRRRKGEPVGLREDDRNTSLGPSKALSDQPSFQAPMVTARH
jgi:hypothetical protein